MVIVTDGGDIAAPREGIWWEGYREKEPTEVGKFPASYVEPEGVGQGGGGPGGADQAVPAGMLAAGAAGAVRWAPRYVAVLPHDPDEEGYLDFERGDAIVVTEGNHNGGSDGPVNWKGYREVAPDLIGLFPASYVEPQPAG